MCVPKRNVFLFGGGPAATWRFYRRKKKNGSHKRFRSAVNGWDLTILTDNFCVGGVGKKLGGFISCYMGYGLRDGVSKISLNLLI